MEIYTVKPKIPCIVIFGFCLFIHLVVFGYGCVNLVWYIMVFGFIMSVLYIAAVVVTLKFWHIGNGLVALALGIMLLLQFVAFILAVIILAAKPVEGIDVVYEIFPPGENYIASKLGRFWNPSDGTYNTLAWALLICVFLLMCINIIGLMATCYNFAYQKFVYDLEDDQVVTRG